MVRCCQLVETKRFLNPRIFFNLLLQSAMVAIPDNVSSSSAIFHTKKSSDNYQANGSALSPTSGCQSQGGEDSVERSRSSSPISLGAFSNYIPKNGGQLIRNRIFVCGFGNNVSLNSFVIIVVLSSNSRMSLFYLIFQDW